MYNVGNAILTYIWYIAKTNSLRIKDISVNNFINIFINIIMICLNISLEIMHLLLLRLKIFQPILNT